MILVNVLVDDLMVVDAGFSWGIKKSGGNSSSLLNSLEHERDEHTKMKEREKREHWLSTEREKKREERDFL